MFFGNKENVLRGVVCILYKIMYVFLVVFLNFDLFVFFRYIFFNKKEGKYINI